MRDCITGPCTFLGLMLLCASMYSFFAVRSVVCNTCRQDEVRQLHCEDLGPSQLDQHQAGLCSSIPKACLLLILLFATHADRKSSDSYIVKIWDQANLTNIKPACGSVYPKLVCCSFDCHVCRQDECVLRQPHGEDLGPAEWRQPQDYHAGLTCSVTKSCQFVCCSFACIMCRQEDCGLRQPYCEDLGPKHRHQLRSHQGGLMLLSSIPNSCQFVCCSLACIMCRQEDCELRQPHCEDLGPTERRQLRSPHGGLMLLSSILNSSQFVCCSFACIMYRQEDCELRQPHCEDLGPTERRQLHQH